MAVSRYQTIIVTFIILAQYFNANAALSDKENKHLTPLQITQKEIVDQLSSRSDDKLSQDDRLVIVLPFLYTLDNIFT